MNWNVNKMYTMYTIRQSFLHKYTYLINLYLTLALQNTLTNQSLQWGHIFHHQKQHLHNYQKTTSMSSCEQIGATVRVPVCLADQINVEGLQVLLQIYLLWLYNLSLYWSTIFMHVHFQYPYVHQLNAIWNAKAMDISTILQLLSTKIKSISQTQSKWIKSHNDKNQDDLDDNLNHTLGFHCTSQTMTQ